MIQGMPTHNSKGADLGWAVGERETVGTAEIPTAHIANRRQEE